MSTVALYRQYIPDHTEAKVPDEDVEFWLAEATSAHTARAWGNQYNRALCLWAAHNIQRTPGMGVGGGTAEESGQLTSVGDQNIQRTFSTNRARNADEAELLTTKYGAAYLRIRKSRAAGAPRVLRSSSAT